MSLTMLYTIKLRCYINTITTRKSNSVISKSIPEHNLKVRKRANTLRSDKKTNSDYQKCGPIGQRTPKIAPRSDSEDASS